MAKARDFIPALKYGHKIYPEDIAGMLGLPYVGEIFYVDPSGGSDSAGGKAHSDALKTVAAAFALATSGKHDVIVIAPTGGTGRTTETGVITWNKRFTHLVGSGASPAQDIRAGMNAPALSAGVSFLDITENGCMFANLTIAGFNDVDELVEVSGDYNSFHNVHFAGLGNATAADTADGSCLHLTGGQENRFVGCTFGLDTVTRGEANFTVELESSASRNVFEDCRFVMHADATTPVHLKLEGASAIDRWVEFKNCSFYAFWTNDGDKITSVMHTSEQTATGHILITGLPFMTGADDWEAADSGNIYMYPASATANAIGIAINPNVS
jgi:hypothetical protein